MREQTLWTLEKGKTGIITAVNAKDDMRKRFYDIGCMEGRKVRMIGKSPFGNPRAYVIADAVIAIRKEDAKTVHICLETSTI